MRAPGPERKPAGKSRPNNVQKEKAAPVAEGAGSLVVEVKRIRLLYA
jgi:hypothetical protein